MTTILLIAVIILLLFGAPIFAVILAGALLGASTMARGDLMSEFAGQTFDLLKIGTGEPASILSTIPLFIFAGYLMAEAKTADRIVRYAQAFVGWMPGGLAIVVIFACAIFTVFSGASGVTIVALGGLVMPSLIKQGYPQKFSLGLVAGTGSVGLLFPPALPLFVYGTVYGLAAQAHTDTGEGAMKLVDFSTDRFIFAGIVPGMILCGILCIYAVSVAVAQKVPMQKFDKRELWRATIVALPELLIPLLIIISLITGLLMIPETAALTAVYVLFLEVAVYKDIKVAELWRIVRESMALVGAIFIIILVANVLTGYFVTAQVPNMLVAWITEHIHSKWLFLFALNVLLLFVGMLMDIFSAIVVVVPLITPIAMKYGIDPYHLGVVFLLNLELGYLTPPVGLNLFITSFKFDKPILSVIRATIPFLLMMFVALALVTYIPALTVVPPGKRTGRIMSIMMVVKDAHTALGQADEIALPDGKVVKRTDCDEMSGLAQLGCRGLFKSYSECADDACRSQLTDEYVKELAGEDEIDDEEDDWDDDEDDEDGDEFDL